MLFFLTKQVCSLVEELSHLPYVIYCQMEEILFLVEEFLVVRLISAFLHKILHVAFGIRGFEEVYHDIFFRTINYTAFIRPRIILKKLKVFS